MTATRLLPLLLLLVTSSASVQVETVPVALIRPEIQVRLGANQGTLRRVAERSTQPGGSITLAQGRAFEEWFPEAQD